MRKYVSIVKCSLQVTLAYRNTYFISILISLLSVVLLFNLWDAIYSGQTSIAGITKPQMMGYLLIVFVLNTEMVSEYRCAKKILDGSILMDLIKPIGFQESTLCEVGSALLFSTSVNLMIGVGLSFFMDAYVPTDVVVWCLFILSLFNALVIKYLVIYIFSLCSFWTISVTGVMWTRIAVVSFFSGALVPYSYLPEGLRRFLDFLPFQAIIHIPTEIYLSSLPVIEGLTLILLQMLWIIILWVTAKLIFSRGIRKVTILGG